jgi:hypothetical protein
MLAGEMREYKPGKSTGPTSPEGKSNSSRNAMKHGFRAARFLILPSECPEDFEAMRRQWMDRYKPKDDFECELVERAVEKRWVLRRSDGRLVEADPEVKDGIEDSSKWEEAQNKRFHLMQRNQGHARKDFVQAKAELDNTLGNPDDRNDRQEVTRGRRLDNDRKEIELEEKKEERATEKAQPKATASVQKPAAKKGAQKAEAPKTAAGALFQGQLHPKKQRKVYTLEQWVEVTIVEGKTMTKLFPSNEQLIKDGQRMLPPPELVYRRINFPHGIPDEYAWAAPGANAERRAAGGCGIQRMTTDTWLEVVKAEAEREDGHIGPTGVGNLPRPKERGGCECPECTRNQAILDKRAAAEEGGE